MASPAAEKSALAKAIARAVAINVIDNALFVMKACKCKTLMPAHLKAVSAIQQTIVKNKIGSLPSSLKASMKGGDPVMASEYYGVDSGRYFDISSVERLETHMFADSTLSRAEMPLKVGGAPLNTNDLVTLADMKAIVKSLKNAPRVNSEALEMIRLSALQHVKELMRKVGAKATLAKLRLYVNKTAKYAHLRQNL